MKAVRRVAVRPFAPDQGRFVERGELLHKAVRKNFRCLGIIFGDVPNDAVNVAASRPSEFDRHGYRLIEMPYLVSSSA